MIQEKIIQADAFRPIRERCTKEQKKIVMCHGVYDLLHYGHLEHLREAKAQGDVLVVSVTAAPYVNKGPDRPYYSDEQRTEFLANLALVDYVVLSEEGTAKTNIASVQPNIFVKGQEFQSGDDGITGNVAAEIALVEQYGGKVYYTQGEVHSSSKLLNNYFNALPKEVMAVAKELTNEYGEGLIEQVIDYVDGFNKLKVLVVGDIIIDEYVFCKAQGLTNKDAAISTRYENEERYLGGALAIARHLSSFASKVDYVGLMGTDEGEQLAYIREHLDDNIGFHIAQTENFVTPVKRRYLKHHTQRDEYDKLFSINNLLWDGTPVDYSQFYEQLEEQLEAYDLVVLCDYGHGAITEEAQAIIEKKSKFLAVNCQTNSANYGMNYITKYHRADTFALDEKELRLAYAQQQEELVTKLQHLTKALGASCGWLTIGAEGAIGIEASGNLAKSPALTLEVKDTVGAGDAFYAMAVLCAITKVPLDIATLLSNASGAIKTHMIGNSSAIGKTQLLKFV
ncbi:MAG: PfkB family carbohydrate kinase, partial [Eubacteriales bacterium]